MTPLLTDIAIALVSVLLGWLLNDPYRIPSWLILSRSTNLNGTWLCHWQSDVDDDEYWTEDHVKVTRLLGKLRMHVIKSSDDFNWDAKLNIKHKMYFIGTWESKNLDSTLGTLWLKFEPQGKALVGYWAGPAKDSPIMSGYVIVARRKDMVEHLKGSISNFLR